MVSVPSQKAHATGRGLGEWGGQHEFWTKGDGTRVSKMPGSPARSERLQLPYLPLHRRLAAQLGNARAKQLQRVSVQTSLSTAACGFQGMGDICSLALYATWLRGAVGTEIQLCPDCQALFLGTHKAACHLRHVLVAWPQEPVSSPPGSAGSPSCQERPVPGSWDDVSHHVLPGQGQGCHLGHPWPQASLSRAKMTTSMVLTPQRY